MLSDEPTVELVTKACNGQNGAREALLQRSLPRLRRWAHGKLPAAARSSMDTDDLVQETVLHAMRRLGEFTPHHNGGMQAYLRASAMNRVRDEARRIRRQPANVEMPEDLADEQTSPLEVAIRRESYQRYRDALMKLSPEQRQLVMARMDLQLRWQEMATRFDTTANGARMAVTRALK